MISTKGLFFNTIFCFAIKLPSSIVPPLSYLNWVKKYDIEVR